MYRWTLCWYSQDIALKIHKSKGRRRSDDAFRCIGRIAVMVSDDGKTMHLLLSATLEHVVDREFDALAAYL